MAPLERKRAAPLLNNKKQRAAAKLKLGRDSIRERFRPLSQALVRPKDNDYREAGLLAYSW
jgi:hypothetical protein